MPSSKGKETPGRVADLGWWADERLPDLAPTLSPHGIDAETFAQWLGPLIADYRGLERYRTAAARGQQELSTKRDRDLQRVNVVVQAGNIVYSRQHVELANVRAGHVIVSASAKGPSPDTLDLPPLVMRGTGTLEGDYAEFLRTTREAITAMVAAFVADGDVRSENAAALVDGILQRNAAALDAIFRRA